MDALIRRVRAVLAAASCSFPNSLSKYEASETALPILSSIAPANLLLYRAR